MFDKVLNNKIFSVLFLFGSYAIAQDTIKIERPSNYDANCVVEICLDDKCYSDSIPKKIFVTQKNIELRMNGICTVKKKSDVFISSFEIWSDSDSHKFYSSQSNFMNGAQKKIIQKKNLGGFFKIKNILVHAPDGFRKMEDIEIKLY